MSWDEALATTDAAVASYFDTAAFTAIAMATPPRAVNADAAPDASRPVFDFVGTLEIEPQFAAFARNDQPSAADRSVRQINRLCLTATTTGWPWVPRQGDRIRSATALYAVSANPDSDGTARVAFWLNRVSF